jgi:hypothetical protein
MGAPIVEAKEAAVYQLGYEEGYRTAADNARAAVQTRLDLAVRDQATAHPGGLHWQRAKVKIDELKLVLEIFAYQTSG